MTYSTAAIVIRPGYADDNLAISRLASLDSATCGPPEPLLLAEVDGVLRAALSLRDGSSVADPFFPSAGLVELLRTRAAALAKAARPSSSRGRRRLTDARPALRSIGRAAAISPSRSGR
jgi:hypothetical protein